MLAIFYQSCTKEGRNTFLNPRPPGNDVNDSLVTEEATTLANESTDLV